MTKLIRCAPLIFAAALFLFTQSAAAQFTPPPAASSGGKTQTWRSILDHNSPRLVVVLTFDQLRADLLTRFTDLFLPAHGSASTVGGFRWFMEIGHGMGLQPVRSKLLLSGLHGLGSPCHISKDPIPPNNEASR